MGAASAAAVALLVSLQERPDGGNGVRSVRSPWYLERGAQVQPADPQDDVPSVAAELAELLRDGGVPGFYDGQFATVADRFDELAQLAGDPDVHHVMRVMAVMALQEAGSGEALAAVLEPLILPARDEWRIEYDAGMNRPLRAGNEQEVRVRLRADLSLHARFALAKDHQPDRILEKIENMENWVHSNESTLLDPSVSSDKYLTVRYGRELIFSVGYHYQQFDDYENATGWYRKLTENLAGMDDTRMAHYNLGCIAALTGRTEEAVAQLEAAYAVGFLDAAWLEEDGDLNSLRELPSFKALRARIRGEQP